MVSVIRGDRSYQRNRVSSQILVRMQNPIKETRFLSLGDMVSVTRGDRSYLRYPHSREIFPSLAIGEVGRSLSHWNAVDDFAVINYKLPRCSFSRMRGGSRW
ncbi:hypothetical protein [[Phormidium] sp. ETS-05]|uniref:hypothetical protein n=1 Tax=[Phormidium] sp. ETS-05 TaxID=222819 RepID=UPI0018EEF143|nr:hypothetical protein [[Phormidium] sp. ETS-05]